MVLADGTRLVRMSGEVGDTEETDGHGTGQAEDHPGHGNATGIGDGLDRVGSHEARQDVRLAEVAQAPGQQGNHADEGRTLEHVEVGRVLHFNGHEGRVDAAGGDHHDDRGEDQGEDHQAGLDGIGPAHRQEATDEGVADGGGGTGPQGGFVGNAEGALEQAGTGHDAGSAVDGEEHQDHHSGEDAQDAAVVFEAVGEVVGQGQRVAVVLGLHAQTASDQQPVEVGTDDQANRDPAFGETGEVDGTRQAHQQPAAHVGGAGGQRGNEAAETAATQDVVGKVVGGAIGGEADQHHGRDIDHESDQHRIANTHGGLPCLFVFIRGRRVVRSLGCYLAALVATTGFLPDHLGHGADAIPIGRSTQGIRPCRCGDRPAPKDQAHRTNP
ncbi:hypothetical protein D9M72_258570 [compost metagenome]